MDGPSLSNSLLTAFRVVLRSWLGPQAPTMTRSSNLALPAAAAAIKLPIFGRPSKISLTEEEILPVGCCSASFSGSLAKTVGEGSVRIISSFADTFSDEELGDVDDDVPERSA
jgi:hypothetical protein